MSLRVVTATAEVGVTLILQGGHEHFPRPLAYNVGNLLRRLALPNSVRHCSLTTLREKLIKIAAKVVIHSRYAIFQMAEVAVPRESFARTLERIQWFGVPPPLVQRGCRP